MERVRTYFTAVGAEFTGAASWLSVLGASLFWVWLDRAMFGDSLLIGTPIDWISAAFFTSLLASVVALAVLALRAPRFTHRAVFSRAWMVGFGTAGAASSAAIALAPFLQAPALLYGGSVVLGIAMFAMNIGWGVVVIAQGVRKAFLNVAGAWTAGLALNGLVQCLIPVAQELATILLPLVSAGLYALNAALQGRPLYRIPTDGADAPARKLPRTIIHVAVASFIFCLAFGFMYGTIIFPVGSEAAAGAFDALSTRGLAALLFFVVGISPLKRHFPTLFAAFILLMTLGVVLVSVQLATGSPQAEACLVIALGYAAFDIAIWTLMASARTGSTPLDARIIALVMAAQQAGILGGQTTAAFLGLGGAMPHTAILLGSLYLFLLASIALIKMCSDAWNYGTARRLAFTAAPASAAGPSEPEPEPENALDAFARTYDLTNRETDVLGFIREGRSVPYIAQALVVSENTVKTHLRHVYTKCNVHNRQALLDLITRANESEEPESAVG